MRIWPVVHMCVMGVGLLGLLLAWYFTRESALLAAAAFVVAYWVYQYLSGRRKRSGANSGRSYAWQTPKPAPEAAPSNGQATPSGGEVVTNTVSSTFNGSARSATYSIQRRRDTNAQVDPSTGRLIGENLFGNNLIVADEGVILGPHVYLAWGELYAVLCDADVGDLPTLPTLTEEQAAGRKITLLRFVLRDGRRYRETHPQFMSVRLQPGEPGEPDTMTYPVFGLGKGSLPEVMRALVRYGTPQGVRVSGVHRG
ncbi:hypothetical protein JT358_02735 [Micrococcales bacterium 31B]|nr:hypothetical protein [Micrococcales bacterium 31B]